MHTFLAKRFTYLFSLMAIFSLLLLSACGNTSNETSSTGKEDEPKNGENTYTVEHAMGSTEIKGTPKRVVILTNEGTEALLSMGVTPVGAVESWLGDPWYDHIKEDMKGVKSVGNEMEPNLETISSLKPDLIIGNKVRQEAIYDKLSKIAPTVFAENLGGNWKENFKLYAKAINNEEKGNKVLEDFDTRATTLKEQLRDQLQKKVSIVRFTAEDVRIYHKDSFSGIILDELGFARPESQNVNDLAETNVTKERIPAMDGDVLFHFAYETGDGEATKIQEEWTKDPTFQKLNVAKEGNVHKVDEAIWNTAGGVIAANLMLDDIEKFFLKESK